MSIVRSNLFKLFVLLSITKCHYGHYRFMAAIIHKKEMLASCAGIIIGYDGEILVPAKCMENINRNKADYFVYINQNNWNNNYQSIDNKYSFEIKEIISYSNVNKPFNNMAIVKTNFNKKRISISRITFLNDHMMMMDVGNLKNCQFIGWWHNNTQLVTINVSLKNQYDNCMNLLKNVEKQDIYCLDIQIDCIHWYGHFFGALICAIQIDTEQMYVALSVAKFFIQKCESVNNIVYVAFKISNIKDWIKRKVQTSSFFDPNLIKKTKSTITLNEEKFIHNRNNIQHKESTNKHEPNLFEFNNTGWDFKFVFHYLAIDEINLVPCILFFVLMFIAISLFTWLECVYI
ncbi:uncharacterized protein LOC142646271 [Dermatophagoides pteronyssinus]|uniref:uncharacterized protein LOC142646271 n=1 Tax=Dermatophagoides pteronyssinus TaxID=6956 RepID=UPI003F671897